jgi:RNA polymerase sigma-70 factor, ECF subfamily
MTASDAESIAQCLAGRPDSYRPLVERYQAPVRAFVRGKVRDAATAEDITQESFIRAYESLAKLHQPQAFFAWLLGIAQRVILEHQRADSRQRDVIARLVRQPPPAPEDPRDEELERAVAELPQPYREVVLLRYYGQLSCAEVAQRLALPLGSVTKNLSRAYAMLRQKLTAIEPTTQAHCVFS